MKPAVRTNAFKKMLKNSQSIKIFKSTMKGDIRNWFKGVNNNKH